MRVLLVSEDPAHLDTPILPHLEALGVSFRFVYLGALRKAGNSGLAGKLRRYMPGSNIVNAIKAAVAEFSPDIVHIGLGRTVALPVMLALRGTPRVPVVFAHGAIDGLNILSPFDWATYFNRRVTRLLLPSRAHVNNWMGRQIFRRLIDPGRCHVHPHPIEVLPSLSEVERGALRAGFGLGADDIVIGTVCSICRIKNLAFVADLVRHMGPPFVFAVVGSGSEAETALIKQAGGDRLRLLGRIPDARRMMSAFDIYVTPTRLPGESFGLAPAEAMAAGVPVVTMNFGGTAEIVEHGLSGLTLPFNQHAWVRALQLLADDEDRRRAMGMAARERIAARFSAEAIAGNCYDLYVSLIGQKAS